MKSRMVVAELWESAERYGANGVEEGNFLVRCYKPDSSMVYSILPHGLVRKSDLT